MGLGRIMRGAAAVALLAGAAPAFAAPREPLVVSELGEPSLVPLSGGTAQPRSSSFDDASERFSLAVAQALVSDQRANELACRSSRAAAESDAVTRAQWRARCLYQRH